MKSFALIISLLVTSVIANGQDLNLIPFPKKLTQQSGHYKLNADVELVSDRKEFQPLLSYFNLSLGKHAGGRRTKLVIQLRKTKNTKSGAYTLRTDTRSIQISASDNSGFFNGLSTLLQLCLSSKQSENRIEIPRLKIEDAPQFAWRGLMLDESRHFFGTKTVKQLLDWMAFYKLNRFHWHLTDANGWRIEIKKYPLLTSIGSRGNFTDAQAPLCFYTQKEIREIVAYASTRNITVIPEIDMPGHATASNLAYPEFSGGKASVNPDFTFDPAYEGTYTYLSNILSEIADLFPSKTVHLGGDELALGIDAWKSNVRVKQMMKDKGIEDFAVLEHYFLKRMTDSASKKGLKVICWDEAVSADLSPQKAYIQWWRHNKPGSLSDALDKGYQVILSPRLPLYLDFVQEAGQQSGRKWEGHYNTYLDLYNYPKEETLTAKNILGVQANLWTETVSSDKRLEFLIFPRIASLAESGWTAPRAKDAKAFSIRLKSHLEFYRKNGLYFYNPFNPAETPEKIDFKTKKEIVD